MAKDAIIAFRGATYELGLGRDGYAIWRVGTPRSEPLEQWPETPEGWAAACARFTVIEVPGTIVPMGRHSPQIPDKIARPTVAALLLAVGVVCGIAGLFPAYLGGSSLVSQPYNLVSHAIYLAAWTASIPLILRGATRTQAGALLATGVSLVTFGLFFADAGTVIAGGAHLLDSGLILSLVGWLACATGTAIATLIHPTGGPARLRVPELGPTLLLALAGLGAAAAFAPSWDSYILRTATGATQSLTAGNAFANPVPVAAGDVITMIALALTVITAAAWRPSRHGTFLLTGAIIPMAAQAISALIQVGEPTPPSQFGISSAQAARIGLTITAGLTPDFWVYCLFVLILLISCTWLLLTQPTQQPESPLGFPS